MSVSAGLSLRHTIALVAVLNLAFFGVEFAVALRIGSVSLFADSADFFEDASVNLLILLALGWSMAARARVGMTLAALLMVPAIATLWAVWLRFNADAAPDPVSLTLTGLGALSINLGCAFALAFHRHDKSSLTRAAFLSARNDALANVAIIVAGMVSALIWVSPWPDLIVGFSIAALNADAAREVWHAARREQAEALA